MIILCLHHVSSAPANIEINDNSDDMLNNRSNLEVPVFSNNSNISPLPQPETDFKILRGTESGINREQPYSERGQLQATPSDSKSTLKARRNNNDLYFCCTEDNLESVTQLTRRSKERERNTKPPITKRRKNPESEEPVFERRPALLLRFFPDGTAVLISKFQLHLHVKPKQIKFEPDENAKPEDDVDFNPGIFLNDGKSYEVTYKRLEAIPSSREQTQFDLDESEEQGAYNVDIDHRDHEFITTTTISTSEPKHVPVNSKSFPLQESTTLPVTTVLQDSMTEIPEDDGKVNKSDKLSPTVGDSPFFIMTSEEMSSLQQQYDPSQASPLKAITSVFPEKITSANILEKTTTTQIPSTKINMQETTVTTEVSVTPTEPSTSTTKCLSFRNQLSLALSTEDNIDNSLLKRHILPTEDCNSSESETPNSLAKLLFTETTTKSVPATLPIITRSKPESTTQSYTQNNLVPYLASHFSNDPSKPDVVVVTSLPVLIDLKSTRNQPVTDVPAWREVTVGVVRDQQGQPLKPRYNNWTAHLRGLRKKPENKFWNDFTTPKPDFRSNARQPIQQSSSQINRSFWTDLQRQVSEQRNKDVAGAQLYRTNPPRNYPSNHENEFQYWRNRVQNIDSRWNANGNSQVPDYGRTNGQVRHSRQSFDDQKVS